MSAKGRKSQPENVEEFFETPSWTVDTLILSDLLKLPGGTWLEPCAGTGNIIKAVNRLRDDVDWIIVELQTRFIPQLKELRRRGRDRILEPGDFVHRNWAKELVGVVDVAIFNPPFSLTLPFVEAAFARAQWVVCLQRKGFFGTQIRSRWLQTYCPDDLSLWKRPSFRSDNQTDSTEYSWYVWPPDPFGRIGIDHRKRRQGRIAMLEDPAYRRDLLVPAESAGQIVPPPLASPTLRETSG